MWRHGRDQTDFSEEIRAHLEMETDRLRGEGLSEAEAYAQARREFGNVTRVEERFYESNRLFLAAENVLRDLRYSIRGLRKSPAFTLVAILSLALGIGANTAVFSYFNGIVLRPLPVGRADELTTLYKDRGPQYAHNFPYPFYLQLRQRTDLFSGVLCFSGDGQARLTTQGDQVVWRAWSEAVSGNYFELLRVGPALGRLITDADARAPGVEANAVISYQLWRDRFGLDPGIIGRLIKLEQRTFTVAGVAPPGFSGLDRDAQVDVWTPVTMQAPHWLNYKEVGWLRVAARRRAGISDRLLNAELNRMNQSFVPEAAGGDADLARELASQRIRVESGRTGFSFRRTQMRQPLTILLSVAGILLLIACANVTNLLLAREAARQEETALRLAIGASRRRLIQQHLTESIVIVAGGAVLALGVAYWGVRLLLRLLPAAEGAAPIDVSPDWRVLAFTAAIALLASIVSGAWPAWATTRSDVSLALRHGRSVGGRRTLVAGQVAMSLALLVVAGLFLRTLMNLRLVDAGMREHNVITFWIDMPRHYSAEQEESMLVRLHASISALPGVLSAARGGVIERSPWVRPTAVQSGDTTLIREIEMRQVSQGYFETIGATVISGRTFDEHDTQRSRKVAIVNQSFARQFFGKADPLGRRVGDNATKNDFGEPYYIAGVIRDVLHHGPREPAAPVVYYCSAQRYPGVNGGFVVRTSLPAESFISTLRTEAHRLDPESFVIEPRTVTQEIDELLVRERILAVLAGVFGMIALVLATVGLYGVITYSVANRTRELGVRMALEASSGSILRMVLRESLGPIVIGLIIGVPLAIAGARLSSAILYGIPPMDALTFAGAISILMLAGAVAAFVPARRACAIDPMRVLRHE
jgi:predicted permease